MTAPASPAPQSRPRRKDVWSNELLAPPGWYGQYRFSSPWHTDKRVVYVCGAAGIAAGQPGTHVAHWRLDGRMSAGQGYVCERCWPEIAAQWGLKEQQVQR